jgi:hypothetical protein
MLFCSNNLLTTLPDTLLPENLEVFQCKNNKFPDREYEESFPVYIARLKAIAETASKERITQRCGLIFEELAKKVWHPQRVERLMLAGIDMEDM